MDYIVAGNLMLDQVEFQDGTKSAEIHLGGPATFAYSGIKLFTDSVAQCSNIGEDSLPYLEPWIKKNDIITDYLKVRCDHSNHSYLVYNEDGTYGGKDDIERFRSDWVQDFGYMKSSPEDIGECTKNNQVKGVYVAQNVDYVFWRKMKELKRRDGFKIMWEIEAPSSYKRYMPAVLHAMEIADIFSINIQEARDLFDVETEEECIAELRKLPIDVTLFRVGAKGLYSVTMDEVHYLPPAPSDAIVDPTGCGNTSTGSALYAYGEGYDPLMIGIMANVGSAQNISQFGVIPDLKGKRDFAFKQAQDLYNKYKNK